ncbi:60S ribosomal protein L31 [Candidatus Woesearchaeota archaeon]|nr:60S ribosomal protein L31 [Candidatus Woesearchaeota archaeon]
MAKKDAKPTIVLERNYNIPLRREWLKVPRWKRTKRAVKAARAFLQRHMKSDNVKLGKYLNEYLWNHGIKNPPHHVKVNVTKDSEGMVIAELEGAPRPEIKEEKPKKGAEKKEEEKEEKAAKKKEEPKKEVKKEEKPKAEEKKPEPKKEAPKFEEKKPKPKKEKKPEPKKEEEPKISKEGEEKKAKEKEEQKKVEELAKQILKKGSTK